MRRRLLTVALTTTVLAVVVFGVPLALVLQRLIVSDERSELESLALRAATTVSPQALTGADPVELPATEGSVEVGVYDRTGTLVSGRGPARADVFDSAAGRQIVSSTADGRVVVTVPVSSGERVVGVARASTSLTSVRSRVGLTWAAMLGAAVVAVVAASLLANRQTRRLTLPIQRLAQRATDLGDGDFTRLSEASGITEIDQAGQALDRTAQRLGELVARERAVTAHASHQLRTPLTSLRLRLETASDGTDSELRAAAAEAVLATDQMSRTIDDLITLAREPEPNRQRLDLASLLDDLRQAWTGPLAQQDRPLRLRIDDAPDCRADAAAVRQVLTTLVDNAARHGRGAVTVLARDAGDALAIDVIDEGESPRGSIDGAGIGLRLAADLARSQAGRLVHAGLDPTTFTIYLPAETG